jgi:small subunit ribosomal protein S6
MREYEAMIVTKSDLPESELSRIVARIEGIIGTDGGQVIRKDVWGVKKLAYPIQKQTKGSYIVYDVATTQKNVIELERVLKLDENVLRSMVVKLADHVDVEKRKVELQKEMELAAQKAAENARERAESDSFSARRSGFHKDEE